MAQKEECINCKSYNMANGLCTEKWTIPKWDGKACYSMSKNKNTEETSTVYSSSVVQDSAEDVEKSESCQIASQQMRCHGCVTTWLSFVLLAQAISILYYLSQIMTSEDTLEYSVDIVVCIVIIVSVFLMFRWNKIGVYMFVGVQLLNICTSLIMGEFAMIRNSIMPLAIMVCVFRFKAKDGKSFFENVGISPKKDRLDSINESQA